MPNVSPSIEASKTIVIIPARNEAKALADLIPRIPAWVDRVIVVDNASTDETSSVAEAKGAWVIHEAQLGYGAACSAGLKRALSENADFIVFMDGDASDDPAEIVSLLAPLHAGEADLVIGRRKQSVGMTFPQRAGTRLVCTLLSIGFGTTVGDIGPFRAATHRLLSELPLVDRGFGWTAEMQAEALRAGERLLEVDVSWRSGVSPSEISGNWRGVLRAARDLLRHSIREIILYRIDRYHGYAVARGYADARGYAESAKPPPPRPPEPITRERPVSSEPLK